MIFNRLARTAAEHFVAHGEPLPLPDPLPSDLAIQRACFVTILENPGRYIRGISGTPLPSATTLAQEIIHHTTRALTGSGSRPVRRQDLRALVYSVAVLGPLQRISDKAHLDPLQYGLYLRADTGRTAMLLPERPGIETPDDQIATAMREGGITNRDEPVTMYRFEVFYDDTV